MKFMLELKRGYLENMEHGSKQASRRWLVIESRIPKLVIWDNAISSHNWVLAKWCDCQSGGLGGLELVVQK